MGTNKIMTGIVSGIILISGAFLTNTAFAKEENKGLSSVVSLYDPYVSVDGYGYKDGSLAEDLKIGSKFSNNIYGDIKIKLNKKEAFSLTETVGFVEHVKDFDQYAQVSYTTDNVSHLLHWKDNLDYTFGMRANIKTQYFVYAETTDVFQKDKRHYKVGAGYRFSNNWFVGASYTTSSTDDPDNYVGLTIGYIF